MNDSGFAMIPRSVLYDTRLSEHARFIWVLMESHADAAGFCWPSLERLQELTGRSRPTVIEAINELVRAGVIERQHTAHQNRYRVQSKANLLCTTEQGKATLPCDAQDLEQSKVALLAESSGFTSGVKSLYPNDNHLTRINEREEPDLRGVQREKRPSGDPRVAELFAYYRERIQPKARIYDPAKIAARLKRFSVEDLKAGIDHFAADWWWMEKNASRGADWFFHSDTRSEQFLNMTPRPTPNGTNGHAKPRNGQVGHQGGDYDAQMLAYARARGLEVE